MLMENRLVRNKLMSTILTIVTFTLCAMHLLIDFCSEMYLHAMFLLFSCLMHGNLYEHLFLLFNCLMHAIMCCNLYEQLFELVRT